MDLSHALRERSVSKRFLSWPWSRMTAAGFFVFDPQDLPEMRGRLRNLFGREIDLIEKEALRNPFRRHEILKTHSAVYAA
jgi:hypothetical protein